jgi:hypothetical protein
MVATMGGSITVAAVRTGICIKRRNSRTTATMKERLCVLTSTDKVVVPTGTGEVLTSTEGVLTSTGGVLTSTGGALTSAEGSTSTSVLVAVFGSMVMNHHGEISAISIVKTEC